MSSAKPMLGYPTRTEAVLALRAEGVSTRDITSRTGLPPQVISALEASGARAKARRVDSAALLGRSVLIQPDIYRGLLRPALARGITANRLAQLIIETVVDEDMIDAVLDDAEERQ